MLVWLESAQLFEHTLRFDAELFAHKKPDEDPPTKAETIERLLDSG